MKTKRRYVSASMLLFFGILSIRLMAGASKEASAICFEQVPKNYALVKEEEGTYVYERQSRLSKKVGEMEHFDLAYILQEETTWTYVESGEVRGFLPSASLQCGEKVKQIVSQIGESSFSCAKSLCEHHENEAFTYTHTTVQEVRIDKQYALVLSSSAIYEYPTCASRAVGMADSGNVAFVLEEGADGFVFVESGEVRGFLKKENLLLGIAAKQTAASLEECTYAAACVSKSSNRSLYYTFRTAENKETFGEEIAAYAKSFVGNLPYVYGGCDLNSAADCSGFTMQVMAHFGITIPRTAQEQGRNGQRISSISEARAGDLIYWESGPHVGIYIGDGKVVQCAGDVYHTASNPGPGPTISEADFMPITSIRRYVCETPGNEKRTCESYTSNELELIWAIVAQEDNESYEGALAVITSAKNRISSPAWQNLGSTVLEQLTAPGQYCYSIDEHWKKRLNGNVPDYVKEAVYDCLVEGIENHPYTSFRSSKGSQTGEDAVQIGGNWYF